jgi:hypothetical protein
MNRQEVFEAWKRHKQRIEVPRDFSAQVLDRLRERRPAGEMSGRVLPFLAQWAARPWAKAALIALGVSLGLVRILLTLHLILFA